MDVSFDFTIPAFGRLVIICSLIIHIEPWQMFGQYFLYLALSVQQLSSCGAVIPRNANVASQRSSPFVFLSVPIEKY
jgi:hypothetical protein